MKLLNFELLVVMLVLTFAATQVSAYDEAVFSNDGGSTIVIDRFSINATKTAPPPGGTSGPPQFSPATIVFNSKAQRAEYSMLMTKLAKGVALPSVVINSFNLSTVTVGTKYDAMRTSFTGVYVTEVSAQDTWVVTAKLTFTSIKIEPCVVGLSPTNTSASASCPSAITTCWNTQTALAC